MCGGLTVRCRVRH